MLNSSPVTIWSVPRFDVQERKHQASRDAGQGTDQQGQRDAFGLDAGNGGRQGPDEHRALDPDVEDPTALSDGLAQRGQKNRNHQLESGHEECDHNCLGQHLNQPRFLRNESESLP